MNYPVSATDFQVLGEYEISSRVWRRTMADSEFCRPICFCQKAANMHKFSNITFKSEICICYSNSLHICETLTKIWGQFPHSESETHSLLWRSPHFQNTHNIQKYITETSLQHMMLVTWQ